MQENATASGSGSDTLTASEESSETATTTDSDTTIHPRLYQQLRQLTINGRSHNTRTRRRRSPPEELPPVPIASDTDSADESRKPARSSRPTTPTTPLRSVPSYTFSNPVQVAAATHPILIPVPIAHFPPIPTPCDGSCYYYNPLLCPLHGPSLTGTPMNLLLDRVTSNLVLVPREAYRHNRLLLSYMFTKFSFLCWFCLLVSHWVILTIYTIHDMDCIKVNWAAEALEFEKK